MYVCVRTMAPMVDDPRKLFLLTTVGNYFSMKTSPTLATCTPINNFLDDANEFLLAASTDGDELTFSNKVREMVEHFTDMRREEEGREK